MDLGQIENLLKSLYNKGSGNFISTASANINNQTDKAVSDTLSRLSTTGMSRSGISGVATNDIYANSANALAGVATQGEQMDMQNKISILDRLQKNYQLQEETQQSPWGRILGQILGIGGQIGAAYAGKPTYKF